MSDTKSAEGTMLGIQSWTLNQNQAVHFQHAKTQQGNASSTIMENRTFMP